MATWYKSLIILLIILIGSSISSAIEIDSIGCANLQEMMSEDEYKPDIEAIAFLDQPGYLCLLIEYYGLAVIKWQVNKPARLVGKYQIEDKGKKIAISGNYVFITFGDYYWNEKTKDAGLLILDLSNPSRPELKARYLTDIGPRCLYIDGNHLFLGESYRGLHVIDISQIDKPSLITKIPAITSTYHIYARDTLLYTLSRGTGLQIFNIARIDRPQFISSYTCNDAALEIYDDYAYVFSLKGGLEILDITDPARIVQVSEYEYPSEYKRMKGFIRAIENKYLLVNNYFYDSLDLLNVTDPHVPALIKHYYISSYSLFIADRGRDIFMYNYKGLIWKRISE